MREGVEGRGGEEGREVNSSCHAHVSTRRVALVCFMSWMYVYI